MNKLETLLKELSDRGYYTTAYGKPEKDSPITSIVCCIDDNGYLEHTDLMLSTLIDKTTLEYLRTTPKEEIEKVKKIARIKNLKDEIANIERSL